MQASGSLTGAFRRSSSRSQWNWASTPRKRRLTRGGGRGRCWRPTAAAAARGFRGRRRLGGGWLPRTSRLSSASHVRSHHVFPIPSASHPLHALLPHSKCSCKCEMLTPLAARTPLIRNQTVNDIGYTDEALQATIAAAKSATFASDHPLVQALDAAAGAGNTTILIRSVTVGGRYRVRVRAANPNLAAMIAAALDQFAAAAAQLAADAVAAMRIANGAEAPSSPPTVSAGDSTSALVRAPPPGLALPPPPPGGGGGGADHHPAGGHHRHGNAPAGRL